MFDYAFSAIHAICFPYFIRITVDLHKTRPSKINLQLRHSKIQ